MAASALKSAIFELARSADSARHRMIILGSADDLLAACFAAALCMLEARELGGLGELCAGHVGCPSFATSLLALARALMSRPKILLIDEPSVGLAPILVHRVIDQIKTLKEMAGLTVLMAEQNFTQAMRVADRGYLIVHGEIAVEGDNRQLHDSDLVKRYYMGL